jgi:monofunctional biosynthetic peptidoglycan transglycosylase
MKKFLLKILLGLVIFVVGVVAFEYWQLPDVSALNKKNPRDTAFMQLRDEGYREKGLKPVRRQSWVPYGAISENLKRAVILGEDAAFFSHGGVDLFELKEAIKRDWERGDFTRGASTITMQLARNLYLSPARSPFRKLREIMIAFRLERALTKRRIFEIYLNVVEWGPGVYGAEAASRHYFSKPASALSPLEAATLAALLPNPRRPTPKATIRRRNIILRRMANTGSMSPEDFEQARKMPLFGRSEASEERSSHSQAAASIEMVS